jgi:YggT family protein
VAFIYSATEPLLAPIRNVLPRTGGFDFSPMIAILVLQAIGRAFAQLG